jgi:hypothetical protein
MLRFYLLYCVLVIDNRSCVHALMILFKQRPISHHAYVMHSAISCLHVLKFPNDVETADR